MTLSYRGSWLLTVLRKVSDWPQRIVIEGSTNLVIVAQPGMSQLIVGDEWQLRIEHHVSGAWRPNASLIQGTTTERGGQSCHRVMTKDHFWQDDATPNDLVVELRSVGAGVTAVGHLAVDRDLRPYDGGLRGTTPYFLGVDIRNTGHRPLGYDATLDITAYGRHTLAEYGVHVIDDWTDRDLRTVGQEIYGTAVSLPPIRAGEQTTAYFRVDASRSIQGHPEVEFALSSADDDGYSSAARVVSHPIVIGDAAQPTLGPTQTRTAVVQPVATVTADATMAVRPYQQW
ncbi:hypothetical protein ACIBF5_06445 [Micromonospora sp. NPDC050417]|uniref:hypothetical protein n=1 Tax=Micromonospora sp. NPDC050417 TaxID=3364280 RepID=UPI00378D4F16